MTATLSDKIKACRDGVINNPYQGKDKRVVFVCSMGILRSATGARLYANKYNTRNAGTWEGEALIELTQRLIDWADEVVFVAPSNFLAAEKKFELPGNKVRVLNIPDNYEHMAPELIKAFEEQYEPIR